MQSPIELQLVLHPWMYGAQKNSATVREIENALEGLGIAITSWGHATLSSQISATNYARLWGAPPKISAGFQFETSDESLHVPAALSTYVESIALCPAHITFDSAKPPPSAY